MSRNRQLLTTLVYNYHYYKVVLWGVEEWLVGDN